MGVGWKIKCVFVSGRRQMDKICCILDLDEKYAVRVGACFNSRHVFPFMMQAFSSVDEYISCAMANEVVLLLVDDAMYDAVRSVPAGQIIRLCEQPMLFEGSAEPGVAKFQAGDNIIRDVLCLYKGQISAACRTKNNQGTKVVCVYSPNGFCGKTTLAMALSHIKGQDRRTLYLNLEEFSAFDMPDSAGNLSDALYYYRTGDSRKAAKLLSVISHGNGFDYIAPAVCARDIPDMDGDMLAAFIDELAALGEYELVVVDIGSLVKEPWKLLENADTILYPAPDGEHRIRRQKEFEKYMYLAGYEAVMERCQSVDIIWDNSICTDGRLNYACIGTSRYAKAVMDIDI